MPITIRHGPVRALGRLAILAGRAQGQQIRISRDMQITNMALAAQDRAAALGAAATRDRSRDFAIQEAAAARIAKQRPARIDMKQRQQLRRTISQAKASGIYRPEQIKQMQIFADLGDVSGLRTTLGALPKPLAEIKPSAKQKELIRQSQALGEVTQQVIMPLQQELAEINRQISTRYEESATQQIVEERPEWIPKKDRERFQELFARRRELSDQVSQIERQTVQTQQRIQLGFTIPEQEYRRLQQISKKQKTKIDAIKRVEKRNQQRIERQLVAEERKLKIDPYVDPTKETIRIEEVQTKIDGLEDELKESYRREDEALGITMPRQMTPGEENAYIDALLAETGGDIEAAKRLAIERGSQ